MNITIQSRKGPVRFHSVGEPIVEMLTPEAKAERIRDAAPYLHAAIGQILFKTAHNHMVNGECVPGTVNRLDISIKIAQMAMRMAEGGLYDTELKAYVDANLL